MSCRVMLSSAVCNMAVLALSLQLQWKSRDYDCLLFALCGIKWGLWSNKCRLNRENARKSNIAQTV